MIRTIKPEAANIRTNAGKVIQSSPVIITNDGYDPPIQRLRTNAGKAIQVTPSQQVIEIVRPELMRVGGKPRGSGGAIAWTPAQITTDVWFDSSDLSTITVDGSNRISQWSDKSGNGRHLLQSADANKPILSSGEITFDGTDDFLATGSNFYLTGNPEFYVFFVFKKTNNTKGAVFGWGQNNTLWAFGFYDNDSTTTYAYAAGNNYNVENITNNTITFCSYSKTPGAINSTSQAYKNGSVTGTSGHSTGTPAIASDKLILGRWMTFTGLYLQGVIYEFIVVRARLSTNERKTTEGYLAHKWGIVASLPSDHPYKSRPPYI